MYTNEGRPVFSLSGGDLLRNGVLRYQEILSFLQGGKRSLAAPVLHTRSPWSVPYIASEKLLWWKRGDGEEPLPVFSADHLDGLTLNKAVP